MHTVKVGSLCISRYHIYNDIWAVAVSKTLVCVTEPGNLHNMEH